MKSRFCYLAEKRAAYSKYCYQKNERMQFGTCCGIISKRVLPFFILLLGFIFFTTSSLSAHTLLDLQVNLSKRVDAFYGAPAPKGDAGKFTVRKTGKLKIIYRGSVCLDHTIDKIQFRFPGSASSKLPGRTVSKVNFPYCQKGKPFEWIWIQELTPKDVGMEVSAWVGPCHDYASATGATFPPQDVQLIVEWAGDSPNTTQSHPNKPSGPDTGQGNSNILGCWSSTERPGFYSMYFYEKNGRMYGKYGSPSNIGHIDNIRQDPQTQTWSGEWHITNNTQHGTFSFKIIGNQFKGHWFYGSRSGEWNGKKGSGNCGYLKH